MQEENVFAKVAIARLRIKSTELLNSIFLF